MKDSNIQKKSSKETANTDVNKIKLPLRDELKVKDLVQPITISRMRILQFVLVGLIAITSLTYYYQFYVKKPSGTEMVNQWVEAAGGMEAWNTIQNGTFVRNHTLYSESGEVLKQKTETYFFEMNNGNIKLLTNYTSPEGINLWMGNDLEGYWSLLNDLPADPKKAGNDLGFMCDSKWCQPDCAMKMSMYRFSMPFNLLDDGILPALSGISEVNGQTSNVVEIKYRPTVGKDRWVLYANQENNLINKIEYHHKNDHGHEFPEEMYWSDYKEVSGLSIPHSWKRYWTNGKILEEYSFQDFTFNITLPNEFTKRPEGLAWADIE